MRKKNRRRCLLLGCYCCYQLPHISKGVRFRKRQVEKKELKAIFDNHSTGAVSFKLHYTPNEKLKSTRTVLKAA